MYIFSSSSTNLRIAMGRGSFFLHFERRSARGGVVIFFKVGSGRFVCFIISFFKMRNRLVSNSLITFWIRGCFSELLLIFRFFQVVLKICKLLQASFESSVGWGCTRVIVRFFILFFSRLFSLEAAFCTKVICDFFCKLIRCLYMDELHHRDNLTIRNKFYKRSTLTYSRHRGALHT